MVGEKEQQHNKVNVRTRDNKVHGEVSIDELLARFEQMSRSKTNHSEEEFGASGISASLEQVKIEADKDKKEGEFDTGKFC